MLSEKHALIMTIEKWKKMKGATEEQFKSVHSLTLLKKDITGNTGCPLCDYYKECYDCILTSYKPDYTDYKNCDDGNLYSDVEDGMWEGKHDYQKYQKLCNWIIGRCIKRIKEIEKGEI